MSNNTKFYMHTIAWNVMWFLICPGPALQTFLVECGIAESTILIISSAMNMIQGATLLLAASMVDRTQNVIRTTGVLHLFSVPLTIFLLFLSYKQGMQGTGLLTILVIFMSLSQLGVGLYSCICYKIPYHIIDMSKYGKMSAFMGALASILTVILSSTLTYAQKYVGYFSTTKIMFGVALLAIIVYTWSTLSMKETNHSSKEEANIKKKKINIFKYPKFYTMIAPNFFRGFWGGAISAVVTVGYYCEILDVKSASILVVLTTIVGFAGYISYPFFEKILGDAKILLIFSALNLVTMPLMFTFPSATMLLVLYAVSYYAYMIIGVAVPVGVTKVVDYEVMGQYSGYRMFISMIGTSAFGLVSVFLLNTIGAILTMVIVGVLQLISGIAYCKFFKT